MGYLRTMVGHIWQRGIAWVFSLSIGIAVLAARAHAANEFINPLAQDNLYDFLLLILNAVIYILFPIIILMIVYTGFLFVAAQGNEQKLSEAKRALLWTVIGALVLLGAKAIALAIQATVQPLLS